MDSTHPQTQLWTQHIPSIFVGQLHELSKIKTTTGEGGSIKSPQNNNIPKYTFTVQFSSLIPSLYPRVNINSSQRNILELKLAKLDFNVRKN